MGKNSEQGAYWREREAAWEKEYESQEADYDKHIRESYDRMIRWCDTQINDFYEQYAGREGISLADAKERVSKIDMEAYARKAEQYCRDAAADRAKYGHTKSTASYFSNQANAEMRLYNLTMKISRLEMLKAKIGLENVRSFDELDMFFEESLSRRSMDELQHFSGILGEFVTEPQKNVRSIVNASFRGATFSDRIWRHQDALKFELAKELERGLIAGKSSTELARDIRKIFGVSRSNAERLLRTELRRVQVDAQQMAYDENGVEYFEFIGGQAGACDECSRLNGTVEKVTKMRPGLNAPPLHPNCRCSTAPYMDRKAFDKWLKWTAFSEATHRPPSKRHRRKPGSRRMGSLGKIPGRHCSKSEVIMLNITGSKISLTRGDTAFITVQMYDNDGNVFSPADDDIVYFNVKRRYSDVNTAIKKQVPIDTMILELEPSDTKSLQFTDYVYEFEYTDSEGHVDTFLNGTLTITSEVD